ncbi:hypothetical protein [Jiangella asiatica]|uniref:Uncharacterized protein n=1 Tax=Jiangella asiatica TaxID=2530372 RepID=A0A4R5CTS5_9ACTN|nr:hypothetical protein [Jiangella asiatica]TDE02820.1 hypothetical protein E1269_21250 [Jiangella asiatica]
MSAFEKAVEKYGQTLSTDEAIDLAGSYGRELDDLIEEGLPVDPQPLWDDQGNGSINHVILTRDLFEALDEASRGSVH